MLAACGPIGAPRPLGPAQFVYDGDGGRVKKITPRGTTIYVGPLYEKTGATITKHILRGTDLAVSIRGGVARFVHGDHLGSSNVLSSSAGARVELLEYTPYGSISRKEGLHDLPQKFTGQRLDDETDLYFYGARYYDHLTGRFLSADPTIQHLDDPQDLNRYSYARNNPVKYIDPSGYGWLKKLFKAFIAALMAVVTAVLWVLPGTQPAAAALTATPVGWIAASAAATTLVLDTGEGRQFQGRLAKEVFDDAFGMRPRAAAFTAGMVSHAVVASAFYIGLTTAFSEPGTGTDFTQKAHQERLLKNAPRGDQPGGKSAVFMHEADLSGVSTANSGFVKQGLVASDIAFRDTPVVGRLFTALNARHAAFAGQLGTGGFSDSTVASLRQFPRLYGTPWTGISHQAFFNEMIASGVPGLQALGQATTHAGWSFYLSSSLYGVNGAYGVSGIAQGLVNTERRR